MKQKTINYSKKKNSALRCLGVSIVLGVLAISPAWSKPAVVQQRVQEAIQTEARAQQQMDVWSVQRDALVAEARNLRLEIQWLELQEKRLQRYTKAAAAKIARLEEENTRYAVISLQLENDLLADLVQLEEYVKQSIPFLQEERQARLHFLSSCLHDAELSIGEKYRRFMEGLEAELSYGDSLEATLQSIVYAGQPVEFIVIRSGTIGLYCLSPDKSKAGIWDAGTQEFMALDEHGLTAVKHLEEMAVTKQFTELGLLPMGKVQ